MANQEKLRARADPILKRLPVDEARLMVEIGVFVGDLAERLLMNRPLLQHRGIDNWIGSEQQTDAYKATGDVHAAMTQAKQNHLYAEARARLERFGERSRLYRLASLEATGLFADASLDIVFVDAQHDYEGCLADCRAWWPKVKPGGLISGHDYLNSDRRFTFGVNQAVNEFVSEVKLPLVPDQGTTWFITKPCA